ncbi:MAG: DNA polymerase III subunit alpha [Firmicutes bacterium]|nr:DNA polymerase III subunit alpha [Bacillota bacterium]
MYTPLWIKTDYSLLSSLVTIKKLIHKSKELGLKSLGITDNNMSGVMEFYNECIKNDIKPIIGLEVILKGKDEIDKRILLYAINNEGYKNLIKISTIQSERIVTGKDLLQYKDNLVCIVPYLSSSIYKGLKKIYKNIYIGFSNKKEENSIEGVKNKVFINEVLFLNNEDGKYLNYSYLIRDGKKEEDGIFYKFVNHHLLDSNEIKNITKNFVSTNTISDMCNVKFEKETKALLPKYRNENDEFEYLSTLCTKGLKKRIKTGDINVYLNRLQYELNIINKMGFCNYFLVVFDFIKFAKKNGILVGPGRGSAAGSLVSYTLGITDIDPIKYDLLFERFLNPERVTMPDIDTDFQYDRRDEVVEYCIKKYGNKNVANIITFGTMGSKQVVRDVARVIDLPTKLTDRVVKYIEKENLQQLYEKNNLFKNLINSNNDLKKLYDISIHLEGLKRHSSIHAAGIVMSDRLLDNIIPLVKNNEYYLTGYTMEHLEDLGLLKMDFLGLKNLTIINDVTKEIEKKENIKLDLNNIALNDKKTLFVFYSVNTEGIFQFESEGMKSFLKQLKVTSFNDIIAAIALFRPGPMDNIPHYINRKFGKEKIDYIHEDLESILKPTYGIMIYQEQIMQVANIMAGYSLGEADILRRAMSKKKIEILNKEKEKFINNSIKKGYTKEIAEYVYEMILKFANYGFNKSHSVAYSIVAYQMAYLKAHYPKYFISNLLNNVIGSEIKTKDYLLEAKLNKINILEPDINLSLDKYNTEKDGIRCPLSIIKNIGNIVTKEILKERENGEFIDFIDFVKRMYSKTINKKVIESLIEVGCFKKFEYNRKTLIENLDLVINYAELVKDLDESLVDKPELEIFKEYSDEILMNKEYKSFGFYLSVHPLEKYNKENNLKINNLNKYINKNITINLILESKKEIETKKKEKMAFYKCIDEYSTIDLTLFPKTYEEYKDIPENTIISVSGRVDNRNDKIQIVVEKIIIL